MQGWLNLKCFMLRERIQTQEGIYYKVYSKWHPRRSKGIRIENGSVVANGNRWGWERLQRAREMIGGDRAMIACTHLSELAELYTENGGLCKWHLKKLHTKKMMSLFCSELSSLSYSLLTIAQKALFSPVLPLWYLLFLTLSCWLIPRWSHCSPRCSPKCQSPSVSGPLHMLFLY